MGEVIIPKIPGGRNTMKTILQLGRMYTPAEAVREIISNGIDNYLEGKVSRVGIGIFVDRRNGSLVVIDNGAGMSYDELKKRPEDIGGGTKELDERSIGEKGYGILSFMSMGESPTLEIYSRNRTTPSGLYNTLEWKVTPTRAENPDADKKKASDLDIGFSLHDTGTITIVKNISEQIIDRYLLPAQLEKKFGEIYHPLLDEGNVKIFVGYVGKKQKQNEVKPMRFDGELVVGEELEMLYIDRETREKKLGKIEVYLWHNPGKTTGKVRMFNKGVFVLPIHEIDQFKDLPWNSGRLDGYITESFLKLMPNRKNYELTPKEFLEFIERVDKKYSKSLLGIVEGGRDRTRRSEISKFGESLMPVAQRVWRDIQEKYGLEHLGEGIYRRRKPKPTPDKDPKGGEEPQEPEEQPEGPEPQPPENKPKPKPKPEGGDGGKRKGILPTFVPDVRDFSEEESHLRSKLDPYVDPENKNIRVVPINSAHHDFKQRTDPRLSKRYCLELFANEMEGYLYHVLRKDGAVEPDEAQMIARQFREEYYYGNVDDKKLL